MNIQKTWTLGLAVVLAALSACGGGSDEAPPSVDECQGDGDCSLEESCQQGRCVARQDDDTPDAEDDPGPDPAQVCTPCNSDDDCGRPEDRCLDLVDGRFCGRDCADDNTPCPGQSQCQAVGDALQCVPLGNQCADCFDPDNDGFGSGEACNGPDCQPNDPQSFPDAPELCDGVDNDCDEGVDEDFALDDSLLNCGGCGVVCDPPRTGEAACVEGQCQIVRCEAGFGDCDGLIDNGCEEPLDLFFLDDDGDRFGRGDITASQCTAPDGYAAVAGDCDDDDPEVFPGQEDLCDGIDNDCDNVFDEDTDLPDANLTQGVCAGTTQICTRNGDFVEPNYGAIDGYEFEETTCDGLDNDCDGDTDEGCDPCTVPLFFPNVQAAADARCQTIRVQANAPGDLTLTNPPEDVTLVPDAQNFALDSIFISLEAGNAVNVRVERFEVGQITIQSIDPAASVTLDGLTVQGARGQISAVTLTGFNVTVTGSTFEDNQSAADNGVGGAVFISLGRNMRLLGNVFRDNQATGNGNVGGAIYVEDPETELLLAANLFDGNQVSSPNGAGAIVLADNIRALTMENNTFVSNTNALNIQASALHCLQGLGNGAARNNIMWLQTGRHIQGCQGLTITYSNHQNQAPDGLGNISADPLFVDNEADFNLQPNSPCVNTGDPDPAVMDLDNSRNDMGYTGGPFAH